MARSFLNKAKLLTPWQLIGMIVIFSEAAAVFLNTVLSLIWWGTVSPGLLWIGAVDALVVSFPASLIALPVFKILNQLESEKEFLQKEVFKRKEMEDAFRESEERFRNFADQSPNMIFINKNRMVVYANHKCEEIMGYTKEEYYSEGFNFLDLIAPEYKGLIMENFSKHMKGEEVEPYEYTLITKGNQRIEALITTKVINFGGENAILGIVTDITSQKKTERALRESEERYRAVVNQSSEGIVLYDLHTKQVIEANPTYLNLLGYSLEEMQKLTLYDIVDLDKEEIDSTIEQILPNSRYFIGERNHRRKDGSLVTVEVSSNIISYGQGQALCVNVRDITPQKKAEGERKALEEQLRQAQKMEAIGRLAGGVAHDFNNLLTVIQGYSDLALHSLSQDDLLGHDIQEIKKAAERASSLTHQLLAFSRKQILQPRVVDLNFLVRDMEKMLRRMIGEDIELITCLDPHLGTIKADPGQLEQVILNLAINARDAMPRGGKFYLETSDMELEERQAGIDFSMVPGKYVRLAIRDTGLGMTAEVKEKVFEPFFTTKEKGKGTGLGLSTIYGIVKQSGGYIVVDSEVDQGTRFTIYFPRIEEETAVHPTVPDEIKPPKGIETILLVEDEKMVRTLAATILQRYGYRVLEAVNGEEGLSLVRQEVNHPIHLVLTDVVMPGINGRQMVDQIWSWRPDIKVLYMSGYTEEAIDHHGFSETKAAFLQKPFTPEALARKVREVLDSGEDDGSIKI